MIVEIVMNLNERELELKAKELELREREIALRERELAIRQKEAESKSEPTPEQVLKLLEVMIQAREIDLKELKYQDKKSLLETASKIINRITHPLNTVGKILGSITNHPSSTGVVTQPAEPEKPKIDILNKDQLSLLPAFQGWNIDDCYVSVNNQLFVKCSHNNDKIEARVRMNGLNIEKIEAVYPDISVFGGVPYYGTSLSEFADYITKTCREFGFSI